MKPRHVSNQGASSTREAAQDESHSLDQRKPSKLGWKDTLACAKEEMKRHNLSIVAAGVAFYVFLGLIPALGAVISIWGLVAEPATIQEQVHSMTGLLPQEVIQIINDQMTRIANQPSGATIAAIIGTLLALWSGAKAMKSIMTALNITYDENETRGFFRLNLTALALTLGAIVGFLLAIGIIIVLPVALNFVGLGTTGAAIVKIFRWPLLALFAALGLGILYRYGADHHSALPRWINRGAVIATLAWIAISAGFSFYAANFGNYNKAYGSLGAVVVLLLWFMISAYVVLFGATLNAVTERRLATDSTPDSTLSFSRRSALASNHPNSAKHN
jgi:membrane protein